LETAVRVDRRIKDGACRLANKIRASDETIRKYVSDDRRAIIRDLIIQKGGNPNLNNPEEFNKELAKITPYEWDQIGDRARANTIIAQCDDVLSSDDKTIFTNPEMSEVRAFVNDAYPRWISIRERAMKNLRMDSQPKERDLCSEIYAATTASESQVESQADLTQSNALNDGLGASSDGVLLRGEASEQQQAIG
jgi:hypothetical protein